MPTISGSRRRGYVPRLSRKAPQTHGVTSRTTPLRWSLESRIREDLNEKRAARNGGTDPAKLVIENYPQGESEMVTML
ncbi:hypothetical protein KCP76_17575 [Salmonella enterica subsp. enterica serovar Weltevreden]|nr:hypothetical protein KCP76_17575 [Salmonella enterica subsp. enterica serovar Weltevreden]